MRGRLAEYANDLLSLGIDGLRLDAAKREPHSGWIFLRICVRRDISDIASTDLVNITSRFSATPYITQEVIWGQGEPIQPSEYVKIGMYGLFILLDWMMFIYICHRKCSRVKFISYCLETISFTVIYRFRYTNLLKDAFIGGGISNLENLDNQGTRALTCLTMGLTFMNRVGSWNWCQCFCCEPWYWTCAYSSYISVVWFLN